MRQCKFIKPLLKMTPPDPTSFAPKDIMGLFEFAKYFVAKDELGGLGEKEIYDTIRFWTMSVRDYLEEYFGMHHSNSLVMELYNLLFLNQVHHLLTFLRYLVYQPLLLF